MAWNNPEQTWSELERKLSGRPVKILYTREEVFLAHRGRHPFHMKYRVGATADGKLTAVDAKTLLDGGAYSSFGLVTTYYSGQLLAAPRHPRTGPRRGLRRSGHLPRRGT